MHRVAVAIAVLVTLVATGVASGAPSHGVDVRGGRDRKGGRRGPHGDFRRDVQACRSADGERVRDGDCESRGPISVTDPDAPVTVRELDARLVTLAGLRPAARAIRLAAVAAELGPRPWLGTETVARMLGLRVNRPREEDELELQLAQPVTRAEAAYSVAVYLGLTEFDREAVRSAAESSPFPALTEWQRAVVARGLRFVGCAVRLGRHVGRPQNLFGKILPGGSTARATSGVCTSSSPGVRRRTSRECSSAGRAMR